MEHNQDAVKCVPKMNTLPVVHPLIGADAGVIEKLQLSGQVPAAPTHYTTARGEPNGVIAFGHRFNYLRFIPEKTSSKDVVITANVIDNMARIAGMKPIFTYVDDTCPWRDHMELLGYTEAPGKLYYKQT